MQLRKGNIAPAVLAAVFALIVLLSIGTIAYRFLEGWGLIESFYFSVATLATVGYGDFYPTTSFSRIFTAFYILFGATIAVASIGLIGTKYLEKRETIMSNRLKEKARKKKIEVK